MRFTQINLQLIKILIIVSCKSIISVNFLTIACYLNHQNHPSSINPPASTIYSSTHPSIHSVNQWLTRLIASIVCLIDLSVGWLIERLTDWLTDWLIHSFNRQLNRRPTNQFIRLLTNQPINSIHSSPYPVFNQPHVRDVLGQGILNAQHSLGHLGPLLSVRLPYVFDMYKYTSCRLYVSREVTFQSLGRYIWLVLVVLDSSAMFFLLQMREKRREERKCAAYFVDLVFSRPTPTIFFLNSFVHSFVRSFVRSFIRSFIYLFVRSFIRSFIRSFV